MGRQSTIREGTEFAISLAHNVLLVTLAAIAIRTVTSHFVGLYVFSDAILLPLSLLQGLAFWSWRERATEAG